jgi:peptide-methionine (R)-S-oxide reductase
MTMSDHKIDRRSFLSSAGLAAAGAALLIGRVPTWRPIDIVEVVEFSPAGKRLRNVKVAKVVHTDAEWHAMLTPRAFEITRQAGTEVPFTGAFWNFHDDGLFRCVCCDTALFDSKNKFQSGTGWPSFTDKIAQENIVTHPSRSAQWLESEVTCVRCDAHLGDVFDDGPKPLGLRYCIDSVALEFVKRA